MPGDYVWSNQRLPYAQSGQWGYLRVLPPGDNRIKRLSDARSGSQQAGVQEDGAGRCPSSISEIAFTRGRWHCASLALRSMPLA